ncbi:MAG: DUF928 domain-containing protein [Rhizonema sp. PD38]|nr:DUF928 domain-containing protein [Rhizonema sp. PD38]
MKLKSTLWLRIINICLLTTTFYGSLLSVISLQQVQAQLGNLADSSTSEESSASGRSRAGATRSQCSQLDGKNLIAIVPQNNEGLTTKEYPDFWFYLPFGASSQSPPAKFRLLNEQNKSVLIKPLRLSLPDKKGIAHLTLPSTEQPLSIGKRYHWYFNITCVNDQGTQGNIYVDGWIKRIEPDSTLIESLKNTQPQNQYILYTKYKIWHEAVSQLAKYHTIHQEEWVKLLSSYSLADIASDPISELKPL